MAQAVRGHHAYVSNAEASPAGPPYRRNMFFYIGKRFRQNRGMHGNNPCKGCTSPTSIAGGHWRLATDWPLQRRPHRQCSLRLRTGRRRAVSRSLVAAHAREAAGARRERRQDAEHGPDYRQSCSDLDGN